MRKKRIVHYIFKTIKANANMILHPKTSVKNFGQIDPSVLLPQKGRKDNVVYITLFFELLKKKKKKNKW